MELLLQTRKNFLDIINNHTLEQLNTIPNGFNNSIIWNFGHALVVQQLLCYKLSGLPVHTSDEIVQLFKKDSLATPVSEAIVNELKALATESITQLEADIKANIFTNYTEYTTSYGYTLSNIANAVEFNTMHEALHLGYAMAMRKSL
jgi:hypothetical protein